MSESVSESASDAGDLITLRSELRHQSQEEMRGFYDITPEEEAALRHQAYFETQVHTPAEKLLWDAEELFNDLLKSGDYKTTLHPWLKSAIWIELIEAQSIVNPGEGYRLLQAMPDEIEKAEALAKFGVNTSPIFAIRAREFLDAKRKMGRELEEVADNYVIVGLIANDDKCCQAAIDIWVESYNFDVKRNIQNDRRRFLSIGAETSLSHTSSVLLYGLVSLAAIGYLPAASQAKRLILDPPPYSPRYIRTHKEASKDHVYPMAVLEYVDHQSSIGQMEIIVPDGTTNPELETRWQELIEKNKEAVIAQLKQDFSLPYPKMAFETALRLRDTFGNNAVFAEAEVVKHLQQLHQTDINLASICPDHGKRYRVTEEEKDGAASLACFFRAIKLRAIELHTAH